MIHTTASRHKKDRARAQFFREFVILFRELALDQQEFANIYPTRIDTAPDGSVLFIFFAGTGDKEAIEKILGDLILYKPSLRKALGDKVRARYVPQLLFKFDATFEKVQRIEKLLGDIATKPHDDSSEQENES